MTLKTTFPRPYFPRSRRIYRSGEAGEGFGHPAGGFPQQKMVVQLLRVGSRTDHVQISGLVCGAEEVPHRERGLVPVQEHVSVCQRGFFGECYPGLLAHG